MNVLKFGGSSLANAERFRNVAKIILDNNSGTDIATVVSAPQNMTNELITLTELISKSKGHEQVATIKLKLTKILSDCFELFPNIDQASTLEQFDALMSQLGNWTKGAELLGHCPDQTYAQIISCGERFSVLLLEAIFKSDHKQVQIFDPEKFIVVNNQASDPLVELEQTIEEFKQHYPTVGKLCLMPGFAGKDKQGNTTTLGRNGSDYSAAVLAVCLEAEECEVWTDVDGVYNSDPNLIKDAKLLTTMTYHEAMELSYFGASILHPKTIMPLQQYNIPCRIKNTHAPEKQGTFISNDSASDEFVRAVTNLPDVAMITVSGPAMKSVVGIAGRVFNAISQANISIKMISQSSAEYSISFCVPGVEADAALHCLNIAFELELQSKLLEQIQVQKDLAVITVVGDKMQHQRGIAAKFFTALSQARVNIIAIAQDSSERSISAIVRAKRLDDATRICHQSLFGRRATIDAIVIGCGTVGSVLIKQILSQTDYLSEKNIAINLVGIANSKTILLDRDGISSEDWVERLNQTSQLMNLDTLVEFAHEAQLLNPVIIDCTSSEKISSQYVDFLNNGFHVVTANKKANTDSMEYYQALRTAAMTHYKKFLYETNVGAGLPVIDNLQGLLRAGDELKKFEGILSGSLSYIFGEVHNGLSLSEATLKARDLGYTEPNPAEDLSGLDVARKALVLAREAGLDLELDDLNVTPGVPETLANISDADEFIKRLPEYDAEFQKLVDDAQAEGKVLRYVAQIDGSDIRIGIQAVDEQHPLYHVKDGENAMAIHTSYYQPVPFVIRGYGAGADVTAAGLFGDLLKTMSIETTV